jgi:hypothetical protein
MTTSSHKVTIDASKDKIFKAITTEQSEENCRARSWRAQRSYRSLAGESPVMVTARGPCS